MAKNVPEITFEEIVAQLQAIQSKGNGKGISTEEIAEAVNRSVPWIRAQIKRLMAKGLAVLDWRQVTRIDGRPFRCPVYRFLRPKPR